MNLQTRFPKCLAAALAVIFSTGAEVEYAGAVPINYRFVGTGSGNVDGVGFQDVGFTIDLMADTDDIVEFAFNLFDVDGTSMIDLPGFGQGDFLIATRVFSNQGNNTLGFSKSRSIGGADLLDLQDVAFAGYTLDTEFGPFVENDPFAVFQFTDVPTTLGDLTFDSVEIVSFEARFKGVIPEPSALLLATIGIVSLVGCRRRI